MSYHVSDTTQPLALPEAIINARGILIIVSRKRREIIMEQIRSKYNTRHRQEIVDYLESTQGEHVIVSDVCAEMAKRGVKVGTTTVYRQMERLVEEGIVTRFTSFPGEPACYQYVGDKSEEVGHYHFKCKKCGRLLHISCHEFGHCMEHIKIDHGFEVDMTQTVFIGLCKECRDTE